MSPGRPEILFPLFADLTALPGVGPKTASGFANLDVERPRDLLFLLPVSVIDRRPVKSVRDLRLPAVATVEVSILSHQPPETKTRPYRIFVRDAQTEFQLVFFHAREDWLRRQLPTGQRRLVSGKVEMFDGLAEMIHPDHILRPAEADSLPEHEPVYPLTAGLTQKTVARAVRGALGRVVDLPEWIDAGLLESRRWPSWRPALEAAHAPKAATDISLRNPARERLAYDELLSHQMTLAIARSRIRRAKGLVTKGDGHLQDRVIKSLPFALTEAQKRATREILHDMAGGQRMNRLLQGDVGSGKTLVAMLASLCAVEDGGQAAIMTPTEILARQHFAALSPMAQAAGVRMALLTGRDKGGERARKLGDLAENRINVVVGTHALFQKDVAFADLRLAIIDEQHRFGVRQRMDLGAKGRAADILVMTATPIPRSLSLAHYGDMDISVLDEKPPGRKPVRTALVSSRRMEEVTDHLRSAIASGRRAYWVCPLVAESEALEKTAAEARFRALRKALGDGNVGLLHGQLAPAEKDAAMADFVAGRTRLLVATTVIEVGVDVPEATIMVIEQAESFGLAQLHQLRGRVGRGTGESTCLLLYDPPLGEAARARLSIMRETEDGFRIAEEDLKQRGAGDVLGVQQSGLPRFRIADLESQAGLMETAQNDARMLLETDPGLASERGQAMRTLLYLTDRDRAIMMIRVG
ncbi:MAG: ATP-dependent DNA helicase RecG [Paracoccaceae bacterium]